MRRQIQQVLLIDRPLIYALGARIWQGISGPITIALILANLTARETGVYYSLGAVIGIQVFFELGLLNVLISQASHAFAASPSFGGAAKKADAYENESKMAELIRCSELWFAGVSLVYGISAMGLGWFSFRRIETELDWPIILFALTAVAAWTFALAPSQAILEGAGKREIIYRYRFFQAVSGSVVVWATLSLGFKLWALVASAILQLGWALFLRYVREAKFFAEYRAKRGDSTQFSWMRDIVPLQWRVAVLSLAYFAATQFLVLIVLYFESEQVAGRLGITLNIVLAAQMAALAWVQTNFSKTSIQHGAGHREAAGKYWRKLAIVSTLILIGALFLLVFVVAMLPWLGQGFEDRFLTPVELAIYSTGCLANHLIAVQSFYVLSRRAPPLLKASLVGFLTTAIAVWIGGALGGIMGLLIAYSFTMAAIGLPLHTWAYLRFRNQLETT